MGIHSLQRALEERAQARGLSRNKTQLLCDLMGWNNRDGSMPESYKGVEPQCAFRGQFRDQVGRSPQPLIEIAFSESIASLLRHLIGDNYTSRIIEKAILKDVVAELGLTEQEGFWVIAQLGPQQSDVEHSEALALCMIAPECMTRVVIPALTKLLDRSGEMSTV